MAILIDGYNLLHVTGIFGAAGSLGAFRQARERLLMFLSSALGPEQASRTTVVFDATNAPPGLPRQMSVQGIQVYYASDHDSADQLLEELIQSDTSPRRLTVVSSDHRVQRAARRRRATSTNSEIWYRNLLDARRASAVAGENDKPDGPLDSQHVAWWLREFGHPGEPDTVDPNSVFPPGYGTDLGES